MNFSGSFLIGIGECLLLMLPTKQKLLMLHRPLGNHRALSSHKPDLGSAHLAPIPPQANIEPTVRTSTD